MGDDDAQLLLEDSELALRRWYSSVTSAKDPELVLTAGAGPSVAAMRQAFDGWFLRRRGEFRGLICGRLRYARITNGGKNVGEVMLVGIVASALAASPWGDQVDPVATAAILISSQALSGLCTNFPET